MGKGSVGGRRACNKDLSTFRLQLVFAIIPATTASKPAALPVPIELLLEEPMERVLIRIGHVGTGNQHDQGRVLNECAHLILKTSSGGCTCEYLSLRRAHPAISNFLCWEARVGRGFPGPRVFQAGAEEFHEKFSLSTPRQNF